MPSYPAYHSNYDTFHLLEKFIDPDFAIHQTCSRLISMLMYTISSSTLIPVHFDELSELISKDYQREQLQQRIFEHLPENKKEIELFEQSIKQFSNATVQWSDTVKLLNKTLKENPYLARQINDVNMQVERIFTESMGRPLYKRVDTRNILYGNPSENLYATVFFPGIHDLLSEIQYQLNLRKNGARLDQEKMKQIETNLVNTKQELRRNLNSITLAFRLAAKMFGDDGLRSWKREQTTDTI